ncbi:hypothetical protein [Blastopirellula retiformator]|uniref:Uncharacterized protein n=1 Tax=Blastopirellula retiformator TaxID=2527970 RepID=A0A5C5V8G9_9BACT|nr:hypothetical protein [Blastopirellula retiformator]TWT34858.1 hypothetical protein Enr8_22730 [Blastopirellula retiformator]
MKTELRKKPAARAAVSPTNVEPLDFLTADDKTWMLQKTAEKVYWS